MTGKKKSTDLVHQPHAVHGHRAHQVVSDEQQLAFWQEKLYQLPTLDLPHDHPRPPVPTHQGHMQSAALPATLIAGLQKVGDAEQATLLMTMLAAFQVVLYRYSGQEDIVLGTVLNEQETDVFDRLLVLRTDLSGTPTFRELLCSVREVCGEALAHGDVPFGRLVEALQADIASSRMPLCQVLFHMQEEIVPVVPVQEQQEVSPFDLVVRVVATGDVHQVEFLYNEHLFEADTMARMLNHFLELLQGVVDDPDQRVTEMPLLTAQERQQLIFEFNDTIAEYPQACMHELFEAQVEKQPDALAVVFEEESLTYGELNARANQLAHHLRSFGIGPESVVGICVEKSLDMVVGLLGIVKSGAAYAPLDPAYPKERLEFMLSDAQVPVLLTQERLLADLPASGAHVICLDRDWVTVTTESEANPDRLATPDHPSYVIYTSGTTGLPKGIVVLHRGVVNNIHDLNTRYGVGTKDRVIAVSSLSFDMCVYEVFGMLTAGACTVIPGPAELKDPVRWAELATRHGVTIWNSAPQLLGALVSHLENNPTAARPPIRLVLLGGDWVPVTLPDRLKALCPEARVIVMGGATEASIHSIIFEVEETDPEWTSIPYGVPMTNQTAYILDANLQVVPVGVAGELHLGGIGLTREYLRRPQLTAEKFIENPIADGRSTRLYKTGDLAKYRPDGNIELLGRIDLQVKIRGLRIEVGEIEMQMKQHEEVRDAVVVALADKGQEKRLVAYVVPRRLDAPPNGFELRAFLAERLPSYMVPALFVLLEKLPLSPNGKVDRRSLPAPTADDVLHDADYVAPQGAIEELLAGFFADVLGVERVGVQDDFFVLGGHSLLAIQVLSRIRETFGLELTMRSLFEKSTVRALAREVEMSQGQHMAADETAILPLAEREMMPLSFAQQRLWFLSRYMTNDAAYNVPFLLTLTGVLDLPALEGSLNTLLQRHEVLRTTFMERGGDVLQVVAPFQTLELAKVELAHITSEERRDAAMAYFIEDGKREFDLTTGPLVRAVLAQVQENEHLLLLNIHHIAFDGWSMNVFVRELATLYSAAVQQEESPLQELPLQYGDYAAWHQAWLQGEVFDTQLAFWKQKLSGELPLMQLPTDRPRPAQPSYGGAVQQVVIPQRVNDGLKLLSKRFGVTLYMTLLAAFQTLLYRYTGQEDLLVGTPIAGRNRAEVESMIGFFVNTLVMRTDLSGEPTFAELLHRVRDVALDAYAHQEVPFEKVVMEVLPDRDLSVSLLFQTMFVLQNQDDTAWELPGLSLRADELHVGTAMFDLTLEMVEQDGALLAKWEYSTDLFDATTIARMSAHFATLLTGIVEQPMKHLWELPLMTKMEQRQLLVEWNDTEDVELQQKLFLQEFAAQVARTPDGVAVVYGDEQLTYRELNERANQLAHVLHKRGVGRETLVGIYMERSLEMIVSLLGIFKGGGAYVPLDPAYPRERVEYMIEDAQIQTFLTQPHLVEHVPSAQGDVLVLDATWELLAGERTDEAEYGVTADSLAYIIYTSGSTGRPKGVEITHRGLVNFAYGEYSQINVGPGKRVLQFASINFDASLSEIFDTLLTGATLVLASPETAWLGQPLLQLLREQRVTHLMLSPSALATLPEIDLPDLEAVIIGGEASTSELVTRWTLTGKAYFNAFGPTEATVGVSIARLQGGAEKITIGRPMPNVEFYILDAHLQPVPVGVAGELHIASLGLARGYLNHPELTTESFIPHPFRSEAGAKLYKTGDLVRYLPDGQVEYLGRIDHQVKIRGFRIELGEIEAELLQHPAVQDAVVLAREDRLGDKRLVAYVAASVEQRPTPAELKQHLQAKLPKYMVPALYVVLDALPLNQSGKVDRHALPVPDASHLVVAEDQVAPRNHVETRVAQIFANTLQVEALSIHDNFFELGGHSLLATQVISRIADEFGVQVGVRTLFEGPTVAELASWLQQETTDGTVHLLAPPIVPISRDGQLRSSFAQQRLWFADQLESNSAMYNMRDVVRLTGPLDTDALWHSLNEIVRRHEALRTNFAEVDGQPMQVIRPFAPLEMPLIDLQAFSAAEREAEALRIAVEEAQQPFDLQKELLIRVRLLKLGAEEHVLLVITHHIVNDGWSTGVFYAELHSLYEVFLAGEPSPLPELSIQYADFAAWQRDWMQGDVLETQLAYWRSQLSGELPVLHVPSDRPRPLKPICAGELFSLAIPHALTEGLKQLSQRTGATLYMTLLTAYNTLLHRYSGQEEFLVGTPIAGRNRQETESLIGFFVNMLTLRTDLSGNPTVEDLIARVRDLTLNAYAHQDLPFEKLVEEVQPQRNLSQSPLFNAVFALQNETHERWESSGLQLEMVEIANGTTIFDLTLTLREVGDDLIGDFFYNAEMFDRRTIQQMGRHFLRVLEGIVADPSQPVAEIDLLSEPEQHLLLVEWNHTATAYPSEANLASQFEEQVELAPETVAVVCGDQRLTYRELNERANQLARYLQRIGIQPEQKVGLCVERSLEMIVGLLGIVKAGGAYVPLDVNYPVERKRFMLDDAQVSLVLTMESLVEQLPAVEGHVICLDRDWSHIAVESTDNVSCPAQADSLLYVIYTSGSTGHPKGVLIPHRAAVRLVKGTDFVQFSPDEVFLQFANISFDAATFEIWGSLLNGARLILYPALPLSLEELGQVIRDQQVTTLFLTTALFHQMAESRTDDLVQVRQLLVGGEMMQVSVAKKLLEKAPNWHFYHVYGPTENTTFTTCGRIDSTTLQDTSVPIGRPIANTTLYVVDARLKPVPVGVPGELLVGGDGLAQGYLSRVDLTEEAFIAHPFSDDPKAKLYRTGDLVRYLPDGRIDILGRIDHQVKVRGFRIELGEIEEVLLQHPMVRQAVVIVREDEPGNKQLVVYVVPNVTDESVDATTGLVPQYRTFVSATLPEYMVPSAFVVMEEFPLTLNGKVDRNALPSPEKNRDASQAEFVAPRNEAEQIVAEVWQGLLGLDTISIYDNFFELGGHSLLGTQVVSRLRERFQTDLTVRALFEAPTVEGLVQVLQANQTSVPHQAPAMMHVARDGHLPLSFAQQRLWFMDQLEGDSALYNMPTVLRLTGHLDVAALEASVEALIDRHEILRTTFAEQGGEARQIIAPSMALTLERFDLTQQADGEQEAARLIQAEVERPFDLQKGPLLRVSLLQRTDASHLLIVNMHHIISDGWSLGIFTQELAALYEAFANGADAALEPLPLQYADFAVWQRDWLESGVLEAQLDYWKEQLAGELPVSLLPTDRPRPAVQTYNGGNFKQVVNGEWVKELHHVGKREGATLYMTLLAAFQTLMHRYSGQENIVVGTPVANRTHRELENIIGFFVNMLVMRTDFTGDLTFRELLRQVRDVALAGFAHQDVPFDKLVEELQPLRDPSYSPLFQVMFALQNATYHFELGSVEMQLADIELPVSRYDLTLSMEELPDGVSLFWEYNSDLFDSETIERMSGHFETLLRAIAVRPDEKVWALPMLTDAERKELLIAEEIANTPATLVPAAFAEQAARTPDEIAVVCGEDSLTYRELEERSNQLAHHLRKQGAGPETLVGIALERSLWLPIAVLGVMKAGATFVPLDPSYPSERLALMIEDAGMPLIVSQQRVADRLPAHQAAVIDLEAAWAGMLLESTTPPDQLVQPHDLAYMIYTSGSTGRPKAVMIEHGNLAHSLFISIEQLGFAEGEMMPCVASEAFDIFYLELLNPLLSGGTAKLFTREQVLDLPRFIQDLAGCSKAHLVPSLARSVAKTLREEQLQGSLAHLRDLYLGGDVATSDLLQDLMELLPQVSIGILYGPTEATILCTRHTVVRGETLDRPVIGTSLGNADLRVYDTHQQLVPLGVPGELYVGGVAVGRGYYGREELTAAAFLTHENKRWYRTGDLVSRGRDGVLYFHGRIDNQVKIRGFRIELGEVENMLEQHPAVQQGIMIAREDVPGDKRLVAYVVPVPEHQVTAREVQQFMKERLPNFMVPTAVVSLIALPLNANQKIDRKALPAPDAYDVVREQEYVAPRTHVEEQVARIWEQTLAVKQVSVHDNFFELGGHSLLATQVISRIADVLGVKVPVRAFFEAATVEGIAAFVQQASPEAELVTDAPPIRPVARDGLLRTSFAQQRLWFADQMESNSAMYHMFEAVRLTGPLDREALLRSLNEIVRRHEALRTTFAEVNGVPMQVIQPWQPLAMPLIDLQGVAEEQREAEALRIATKEAQKPFDLTKDLMMRAQLMQLGEQQHMLLIVTHHIASDGWSTGVFYRELKALYEAYSTGAPSPLPDLAIQYADFAEWQRDWMQGEVMEAQLAYWEAHLSGELPVLQVPSDRPRPNKPVCRGDWASLNLPQPLAKALKRLSQCTGTSLYMPLLAAFNTLMYRYSGQDDFLIGSPIANRNHREIEDLIGFFVNMLTLRTDLSGNPTFEELIHRVQDVALGAFAHQDLPFEKLVEQLQPDRDLSQSPLFNAVFALQNAPRELWESNGLVLESVPLDVENTVFDLTLQAFEEGDNLVLEAIYNADMYNRSTIERMLRHFTRILQQMVENPTARIDEVELIDATERHQLLVEWNDTTTPYPNTTNLIALFEAQVTQAPDAIAVVFADQHLTYCELNERANQVAHYLQALGVQPEQKVGLCVERSLEMIVGLLGIVKAGGVYVPLDVNYPTERLRFMMEDAEVSVLITLAALAERLPVQESNVVCLDTDWVQIAERSVENVTCPASAESLLYVIYTSGSTGQPKGVLVPHRAVARLVKENDFVRFAPDEVFLQFANISFDAATFEIWGSLLNGAQLVLYPAQKASLEELGRVIREQQITTLFLTTALFHQMADTQWEDLVRVRQLLAGGEMMSLTLVKKLFQKASDWHFYHVYGPTETTTFATCGRIDSTTVLEASVPIGRPIANTTLYVLDRNGTPVPVGVPGELLIGGDGVAHGYLNHLELTAEKFVPNPFSDNPNDRLYRTGDLVRYLPDGTIDILGRIDNQVKVRGFRIELGEVEAQLSQHDEVREVVVVAHEGEPGDRQLVAYIVPDYEVLAAAEQVEDESSQSEQVSQWEMVFDKIYDAEVVDDEFNTIGWDSHYTGKPIPQDEMREWLDHTIDRILSVNTKRVVEVGCGTGMILYNVLPHAEHYTAIDISSGVLETLHRQLTKRPDAQAKVKLLHAKADELGQLEANGSDLVIFNSVVQYFPSIDYLVDVIGQSLHAIGERGSIFLGDLRSLPTLKMFHATVALHRSSEERGTELWVQQVNRDVAKENELVIDPEFFYALQAQFPQITRVEVQLKRGRGRNELTQFRYDVILHVGAEVCADVPSYKTLDWNRNELSLAVLRHLLRTEQPPLLAVQQVPDARIFVASHALHLAQNGELPVTVGELRALLAKQSGLAVEPDDLYALETELPYLIEIRPANTAGCFDVLFRHRSMPQALHIAPPSEHTSYDRFATNPTRAKLAQNLVPLYRKFAGDSLPDYMVPSAIVILDELPLTPNGKVDRKALPSPDKNRAASQAEFVAPRNELEEIVADVWSQVLGIEQISVHDNFFELGGHSLLATQVVSRLRDALEIELSLQRLFEAMTIAQIAEVIESIFVSEYESLSADEVANYLEDEEQ